VCPTRIPVVARAAFAALGALLAAFVAALASGVVATGVEDGLYLALLAGTGALCLARGLVGRDRLVWSLVASGLLAWTAGDVYWTVADPEGVSPADAGYLAFYAFTLPALVLLLRRRASGTLATLWVDGWIAALTVAALGAYGFVEPVMAGAAGADPAYVLVNLAYPIGDTLLLALVAGAGVAMRGALRGPWLALGVSLVVLATADGIYLNLSWAGTYTDGTLLDAAWPAAALALAGAAWISLPERSARRPLAERAPIVWPVAWGTGSLAILAALSLRGHVHALPASLAIAGVASVLGRLTLTDAQNRRLAVAASEQALTDAVTGLGNHRALTADLEEALAATPPHRRVLVAVFDLNGFKAYNDVFGHPAGDALLARLAGSLRDAIGAAGRAYRMGGDEFCVIAGVDAGAAQDLLLARIGHALQERGGGFTVTAAGGHVLAEPGRTTARVALSDADERMYAAKRDTRTSSLQQTSAVLAAALRERHADATGSTRLDRLAELIARHLGMAGGDVAHVRHAVRLRDVGKLAIPEGILGKPGAVDDAELQFIRSHTLVGERIAAAAPALAPVARLIRSSHERHDGAGYPDGLAGEDIPLGARIVFVCDAFAAMTSERPYRAAMTDFAALAELSKNAGTQFDPVVVRAFAYVLAGDAAAAALAA
jgi:diguanylate cyclase (GGDEF)-like protein